MSFSLTMQCLRDYEECARLSQSEEEQREVSSKIRQAKVALKRAKRKDYYRILSVQQVCERASERERGH